MTTARIAVPSPFARPVRITLIGLSAALLTGLFLTNPAPAAPRSERTAITANHGLAPNAPVDRAWDVLPRFPQRLTAWLYESQRQLSLSASPFAPARTSHR